MSEWWSAFLWGAGAMALGELLLSLAVFAVLRRRDKRLAAEATARILTRLTRG
jgi:hypothetical protein